MWMGFWNCSNVVNKAEFSNAQRFADQPWQYFTTLGNSVFSLVLIDKIVSRFHGISTEFDIGKGGLTIWSIHLSAAWVHWNDYISCYLNTRPQNCLQLELDWIFVNWPRVCESVKTTCLRTPFNFGQGWSVSTEPQKYYSLTIRPIHSNFVNDRFMLFFIRGTKSIKHLRM